MGNAQIAGSGTTGYFEEKEMDYFDCIQRVSAPIQAVYYDSQSDLVGRWMVTLATATFVDPVPDSFGAAMMTAVCDWKHTVPAK